MARPDTTRTRPITEADTRRGLSMILMIVSSIVISFGGLIMRSIETANPFHVNLYRSIGLLTAVVVFLLLRYRRQSFTVIGNIGLIGLLGGVLLAAAGIVFLQALSNTTIANTLFILGAIPFFAALFARLLLGERISRATQVTMAIAAIGLLAMVREGISLGAGYGNAMALLTAVFFALYAVIVRGKRQTDMMPTLLVSSVIIMLVSLLVLGGNLEVSWRDLGLCMVWGALISGVANFLFIYASRHLAAAEVTLFMLLEFALGPIWVWLFVQEIPTRWTIIGGIMIIAAVAIRAVTEILFRPRKEPVVIGPV